MIDEGLQVMETVGPEVTQFLMLTAIAAAWGLACYVMGAHEERTRRRKELWDSWMETREKSQEVFNREMDIRRLMHAIEELGGDPEKYKRG